MRIVRFVAGKQTRYGVVEDSVVREIEGDIFGKFIVTDRSHSLKRIRFLTPTEPSKIVGVGLNYRDHAEEMRLEAPDEPIIFLKPSSASLPHRGRIIHPKSCRRLDYEAELGIVVKRTARAVPVEKAHRYILGYVCVNDVTARDLQRKDGQWTRAKSFDTFAPFGPWVETDLNLSDALIRALLNGVIRQESNINNLIFEVPHLIHFVSSVMTLYPGDVITTGTPSGIGPMRPGDTIEIEVEGIGRLSNTVVAES
ncbi:Ureidoglycolate lyase [Candidatus Methylomirabilis lanthanidiphila]|uniref:Ureidoglycolate lyase n=1 Tax=Candidatus Methylomirabilis lanthanidiphila TaxID=2211376 RepID=A0A564ZFP7_9BACT|nr:fumarylacetoacetate hydrolase family protein [Candidatus Methylomirabilis lanthanidiphila]VUZ84171.1 Ureidoglycolate lyase [Candidatus Methylomirabilis lanthanidiphila]